MRVNIGTKYSHQLYIERNGHNDPGIGSSPFSNDNGSAANFLIPTSEGWSQLANYALELLGIPAYVEEKTVTKWALTEYEDS